MDPVARLQLLRQHPEYIKRVKNPTEDEMLAVININTTFIKYIAHPTPLIQVTALKETRYYSKYTVYRYINEPTENAILYIMSIGCNVIEDIPHPTEKIKLAAVELDGENIQYIDNPSMTIQLSAVQKNGNAIQYIKDPSAEVQLAAVRQNGNAIRYIKNPSAEVQLAAVTEIGTSIEYIEHPSITIQKAAVLDHPDSINFIEKPSDEIILLALEGNSNADNVYPMFTHIMNSNSFVSDIVKAKMIESYPYIICYKPFETNDEMKMIAINKNASVITHIDNPTDEMKLAALHRDGTLLMCIEDTTPEMELVAVLENGRALQYIKDPSPEMQLAAVQQNGFAIEYIADPSEELQIEALKYSIETMHNMPNQLGEKAQVELIKNGGSSLFYMIHEPCLAAKKLEVSYDNRMIEHIPLKTSNIDEDKELINYALSIFLEESNEKEILYLFEKKYIVYEELDDATKLAIEML